jgi:hypothetical protein
MGIHQLTAERALEFALQVGLVQWARAFRRSRSPRPAVLHDVKERVLIGEDSPAPGAVQHFHIVDGSSRHPELTYRTGCVSPPIAKDDHAVPGFSLWEVKGGAILAEKVVAALNQLERRPAVLAVHVTGSPVNSF